MVEGYRPAYEIMPAPWAGTANGVEGMQLECTMWRRLERGGRPPSRPWRQARQQHRDDAGEEDAVERTGAADRRDGGAQAAHSVEIEQVSTDQRAEAAAGIGHRGGALAGDQQG